MKLGVLTWYFGNNYGAKLHSFALSECLKKMGHSVEMINFSNKASKKVNVKINLNFPNLKRHPLALMHCINRCRKFDTWTREHYEVSKFVHNAEDIDGLGYDAIIIGSDEVFNYKHPFFSNLYYGVGIYTPIITYAPSSGQAPIDKEFDDDIIEGLNNIRAYSSRDYHTRGLLINNGISDKINIVLDPTFLWTFDNSRKPNLISSSKYILIYSFNFWDQYKKQIQEYAERHDIKIICVGRDCIWADKSFSDASVQEWLWLFENAECIFTDSFHGTVFSIKNEKPFIIVSRNDKLNKVQDLFEILDINKTFYDGSISLDDYLFMNAVNYDIVNKRINEEIDKSIEYLMNSLGEI